MHSAGRKTQEMYNVKLEDDSKPLCINEYYNGFCRTSIHAFKIEINAIFVPTIFDYFVSSKNVTKLGFNIQNEGENVNVRIYAFSDINCQHYFVYLY